MKLFCVSCEGYLIYEGPKDEEFSRLHEHVTDDHKELQLRDEEGNLIECLCGELQTQTVEEDED